MSEEFGTSKSFTAIALGIHSASLLVGAFNSFTFKVIIDKYDPVAIYFIVLRIHLPIQGTRVRSLTQEDAMSHGATKPRTTAAEPVRPRAPCSPAREATTNRSLSTATGESLSAATTQHNPKYINHLVKKIKNKNQ